MLLFKDYNFAFLHINKTAGTSTKEFLTSVMPSTGEVIGLGIRPRENFPKVHEPLSDKITKLTQLGIDFDELKVLVNIRNPYERWLSLYTAAARNFKEKRKKVLYERAQLAAKLPFDQWLEGYVFGTASYKDPQHGPQSRYLFVQSEYVLNPYIPSNVYIMKSENVDKELPKFLEQQLGIKTDLQLPRRNVSNYMRDRDTMSYYPDHLRKLVYDLDKYIIDKYYPEFKYKG